MKGNVNFFLDSTSPVPLAALTVSTVAPMTFTWAFFLAVASSQPVCVFVFLVNHFLHLVVDLHPAGDTQCCFSSTDRFEGPRHDVGHHSQEVEERAQGAGSFSSPRWQ